MTEFALHGHDLFGEVVKPRASGPLAELFTVPPFSVLDARSGAWQDRKDGWKRLGLRSELGRKDDMAGASWGAAWMEKHGDGSDAGNQAIHRQPQAGEATPECAGVLQWRPTHCRT